MNKWLPRKGLGGIPVQSKPLVPLNFGALGEASWSIEQIFFGAVAGGSPYLSGKSFCADAEAKLAFGLGITGTIWLFTGMNHFAISGAATALGLYAVCKLANVTIKGGTEPPLPTGR